MMMLWRWRLILIISLASLLVLLILVLVVAIIAAFLVNGGLLEELLRSGMVQKHHGRLTVMISTTFVPFLLKSSHGGADMMVSGGDWCDLLLI